MNLPQILTIVAWSICVIEFVVLFLLLRKKVPAAVTKTNKFFQFMAQMMSEANGAPSSIRFNLTNMQVQWVTVISFGFIWTVVKHPELMLAYLALILVAVETAAGLKVWQKGKEAPMDPTSPMGGDNATNK